MAGRQTDDPWRTLLSLRYEWGSVSLQELYRWFGIEPPEEEPAEVIPPSLATIAPNYPLYAYQNDVISRALRALEQLERRVLIHMPTGAGKTRSAMVLISRFLSERENPGPAIWLAHSEELCDQAAEEFQKCWSSHGNRPIAVGRFYGVHEVDLGGFTDGLIVAGLPKLYSRSGSQQSNFLKLKRRAGLVVMDEAHQAVAPTYEHLLDMLAPAGGNAALVGLSATPGRSWLDVGEDKKLAAFFAHSKVELRVRGYPDPITYLQDQGYLAKPDYVSLPYNPSTQLSESELKGLMAGFDVSVEILRRLGEDDMRNLMIVRQVLQEIENDSHIVIFACSVDHAHLLADTLSLKGVSAAAVSSDTPASVRRQTVEAFRAGSLQVIVNYGILTTGFDAPKTNVAIIARPTRSVVLYSQMVGRAMRGPRAGGNEKCRIYTVVDRLPGFRNVSEGFSHWEDIWNR